MKKLLPVIIFVTINFALQAQIISVPSIISIAYKHTIPVVDSTMVALGYKQPKPTPAGIYPVVYDIMRWDDGVVKFPDRYEISLYKSSTDSIFSIGLVSNDSVRLSKLIDEFKAEKFTRTAYGDKSINKDYTSIKYPNIVMRISYNQLLNMGPNKLFVMYSWR